MAIEIDEGDLTKGLLGLLMALVEIIRDTLRLQVIRRMEAGCFGAEEIERLGMALMNLDCAIQGIKEQHDLSQPVMEIRHSLDELVGDALLRAG